MSRLSFGFALMLSLGWTAEASAQAFAPAVPPPAPPPAADSATPSPDQALPPAPPPPPADQALPPAPPPAPADTGPALVSTAPTTPASPLKRSRFFFTFQLGGGYFHATSGTEPDTRRFSGGTVSGLLAMGGRLGQSRKVVLAGAFLRDQVIGLRSRDKRIDGDEPNLEDVTFGLWAVGVMVDVGVQTAPGLHFQGLAGVGALSVSSNDSTDPDDPTGLMASVAAGYDFKVGEHWAVGGLLRATYAPLDVQEATGTTVYMVVPALLFTVATR